MKIYWAIVFKKNNKIVNEASSLEIYPTKKEAKKALDFWWFFQLNKGEFAIKKILVKVI